MRRQRKTEGFNLAFLDIMSCGLGAVILVLILLKLQPEDVSVDVDVLKADLQDLQKTEETLAKEVAKEKARADALRQQLASLEQKNKQISTDLSETEKDTRQKRTDLDSLKKRIESRPPLKQQDVVQDTQKGEEDYLLGLKVEGKRIVFLIDTSASMTDEKLIDIVRRKAGNALEKKQGPKWQRTVRVVKWLAGRIPKKSEAVFIGFNRSTASIGPTGWFKGTDASAIQSVYSAIEQIVPDEATNLQEALEAAKKLSPAPTNYYLVTDGLPTDGNSNYRSLNPFAACSSLRGSGSTISGECRTKLFRQTVRESGPGNRKPVNIILLPLEGDPQAAPEFWSWSFVTGGLLISPAVNWP